ncbi:hypothetical protein SLEP1_g42224 [Rubroshorea leprosula]|uniref:Uncharacterized protein n=1 Tax=Rubroshorea leprosula TaxID=152421 RepID=A0AAV5L9I7_9ROSI|nr:hypothetical protein SLEP1_g42224 [Rubroshorea leprosula]
MNRDEKQGIFHVRKINNHQFGSFGSFLCHNWPLKQLYRNFVSHYL